MGWCSGTDVFDPMVKQIYELENVSRSDKKILIKKLIEVLQDSDWDCESDSSYWNHSLVREAFKEVCPGWDWKEIEENE